MEAIPDNLTRWIGTWTLNPDKTEVQLRTKTFWVVPVKASARAVSGTAEVGPHGLVSGTLVIDAASFATKNKKRDQHLRSGAILAAAEFPTIVYTATDGHMARAGQFEVSGILTVRGRSRPVTLRVEIDGTANSATVSAEVEIDRHLWDVTWPEESRMGAGHKNQVAVRAHFEKVR